MKASGDFQMNMTDTQLAKFIINLIKTNPEVRRSIHEIIGEDVLLNEIRKFNEVLTNIFEDLNQKLDIIVDDLKNTHEKGNEKFEQIFQRFAEQDKKFEQIFQTLKDHQKILEEHTAELRKIREDMNQRFAEQDKKFEQIFQRFAEQDKKFEQIFQTLKEHGKDNKEFKRTIELLFTKIDELGQTLGITFEDFVRINLTKILQREKILPYSKKLRSVHLRDESEIVNIGSKDVEIDLYCEDPLIIGEVTEAINNWGKIEKLIRRIKFVSEKFGKTPKYSFLITKKISLNNDDLKRFQDIVKEYNIIVINTEFSSLESIFSKNKDNNQS